LSQKAKQTNKTTLDAPITNFAKFSFVKFSSIKKIVVNGQAYAFSNQINLYIHQNFLIYATILNQNLAFSRQFLQRGKQFSHRETRSPEAQTPATFVEKKH
jgi:hypothetical protein